jgi:hypothetical protein
MKEYQQRHKSNAEEGRRGVDDAISGVMIWPPNMYFYVWASYKEWLEGIYEW